MKAINDEFEVNGRKTMDVVTDHQSVCDIIVCIKGSKVKRREAIVFLHVDKLAGPLKYRFHGTARDITTASPYLCHRDRRWLSSSIEICQGFRVEMQFLKYMSWEFTEWR